MKIYSHPSNVLYICNRQFPQLAACEHFAGSEKLINKALQLQSELSINEKPIFDITADCEDGATTGNEKGHAEMIANLVSSSRNRFNRVGVRIHDARHPLWRDELDIIISRTGQNVAYFVLPKPRDANDVLAQISEIDKLRAKYQIVRKIPIHILIETPGALHDVWKIAQLPHVEVLDFGLMDYISAHHGAIPASAMRSPGQFTHALVARAKCEIAAAALGNNIVPSHNVTTEIRDSSVVKEDALRARIDFGFMRMWSIHPNQILPIVESMRPDFTEVADAANLLVAAQNAEWGPIQWKNKLHDRASYRYYWELLQRAQSTGMIIPDEASQRFF